MRDTDAASGDVHEPGEGRGPPVLIPSREAISQRRVGGTYRQAKGACYTRSYWSGGSPFSSRPRMASSSGCTATCTDAAGHEAVEVALELLAACFVELLGQHQPGLRRNGVDHRRAVEERMHVVQQEVTTLKLGGLDATSSLVSRQSTGTFTPPVEFRKNAPFSFPHDPATTFPPRPCSAIYLRSTSMLVSAPAATVTFRAEPPRNSCWTCRSYVPGGTPPIRNAPVRSLTEK